MEHIYNFTIIEEQLSSKVVAKLKGSSERSSKTYINKAYVNNKKPQNVLKLLQESFQKA